MTGCPRCGLTPDYIPKGPTNPKPAVIGPIRKVFPDEFNRCAAQTGSDIQSGPIYCGARATHVAVNESNPGFCFAVCDRHLDRLQDQYDQQEAIRRAGDQQPI